MDKRYRIALLIGVLSLGVSVGGLLVWFFSPGVHMFWKFASFDIKERRCYIVDVETEEIIGQTTLTICGSDNELSNAPNDKSFEFKVDGYTDIVRERQSHSAGAVLDNDGVWRVVYREFQTTEDSLIHSVDGTGIWAIAYFGLGAPDDILVRIDYETPREDVFAVCAENEELVRMIIARYYDSIRND